MKKHSLSSLLIILLLFFSQETFSQEKLKIGVNEIEKFYSENYVPPKKIEFVFSGNARYIVYFFSDLEEEIKKKLPKENISFSIRYADKKTHFKSKPKVEGDEMQFYLNIDNSTVVDEKNGSDRIMKFSFNGELKKSNSESVELRFKTIVKSIHDITSENEAVIKYLVSKILNQ